MTVTEIISGVPGVLALVGAIFGYGRITQRVNDMQRAIEGDNGLNARITRVESHITTMGGKVEVIEERTKDTKSMLEKVDHKVDRLLERSLRSTGA